MPDDVLERTLGPDVASTIDPFDRVQLAEVLRICRGARTLSDAGRTLFAVLARAPRGAE
jgi:transcriptional regulatory protein RtcR